MSEDAKTKPRGFNFTFEVSKYLEIADIWPDGDAPENPTAEDVAAVVKESGGVLEVLRDWDLDDEMELEIDDGGKSFARVIGR